MRHVTIFFLMLCITSLSAQSVKKADKDFELGNFRQAALEYNSLAQKNSRDGHVASRLADCYRIMNQIAEAALWYEKASSLTGASPMTLLHLGQMHKMLGNYQLASKSFDRYGVGHPGTGKHFSASCDFAEKMSHTPSPYVVRPEYLNTPSDEFGPAVYESHIVFSTTKSQDGNEGESHLVISSLDQNNYLKLPAPLRTVFDQTFGEGPLTYSSEANLVFFAKNNFKTGYRHIPESGMKMSLHYALLDGDGGWTEIKPFPFNGSGYSSGYPSLSADGKTLFFASDRPDGFGGYDLYVSRKIGDTWTTPKNLGPKVNTQGNEIAPFFDGATLYFSSDWHKGLGGYDCFKASRTNNDWDRIFHLGAQVNSSGDDIGFVHHPESKINYFASNRTGGKGNYDLYRAIRQTDEIVINVTDAGGDPIANAGIDMSACSEGTYRSDISGIYKFQALGGFSCDLLISKAGYTSQTISILAKGEQKVLDFKVTLAKDAEKINGLIVNGTTNQPEQDVLIRATNQNSGAVIETYSAPDGSYDLGLASTSVFVIRYSKVGFSDAHNRLNTGDKVDANLLGTIQFYPVYAATTNGVKVETTGTNTNPSVSNMESGFAVQVAASDASNSIDMEPFQKLKGMGRVFMVEEKGLSKIRVGTFKTRAAAEVAKKSIQKQGFAEAFVVSQEGSKLEKPSAVVANSTPTQPKIPTGPITSNPSKTTTSSATTSTSS